MAGTQETIPDEPTREAIDAMPGPVLLEFGTTWCGHCRAIAPQVARLLESFPDVRHIRVEDGPGQPLGRSFRVKLWPTFVFLRDGSEVDRAVRPGSGEVRKGLAAITGSADHSFKP